MNAVHVFFLFYPELVFTVFAFMLIAADLLFFRNVEIWRRNQQMGMWSMLLLLAMGGIYILQLSNPPVVPPEVSSVVMINELTVFLKLLLVGLALFTVGIATQTLRVSHVGEFHGLLMFSSLGMCFLVMAQELILIFISLELVSLSLYLLVAFHKFSRKSAEAALKYFLYGSVASAFLLFGASYIYGVTGATNLEEISRSLRGGASPLVMIGIVFILVGFGFKIAVVPFHMWAPDVYEGAPTPVTAYIATGSKVASFFILLKVMWISFNDNYAGSIAWQSFEPGWMLALGILSGASMIWGNLAALVQKNVKRLLAYSSIAHGGYILLGVLAASITGLGAVLFYLVVYSFAVLGTFGVVSFVSARYGGDNMENFRGLAVRSPRLAFVLLVFVLSLAGIPPLAGFLGKFLLFSSILGSGGRNLGLMWLVMIAIATSCIGLYYYLVLLKHVYVAEKTGRDEGLSGTGGLLLLCAFVIILGVFPFPLMDCIQYIIENVQRP